MGFELGNIDKTRARNGITSFAGSGFVSNARFGFGE